MPYNPTQWNPGGPPGISAERLNKIEQGIADATDIAEAALPKSGGTMTGNLRIENGLPQLRMKNSNVSGERIDVRQDNNGWMVSVVNDNTNAIIRHLLFLSRSGAAQQVNGNQLWHTGNDGPGSGLDADLLDGWHLYSNISELGFVEGSETMVGLCEAMPNRSILFFTKASSNPSTDYPVTTGFLTIKKISNYRAELTFTHGRNGNLRRWIGYYDLNLSPRFSGWQETWHYGFLRWNSNGFLEYNDGGTWRPAAGATRSFKTTFSPTAADTLQTVINITNRYGSLDEIMAQNTENTSVNVRLRITIDGSVVADFTGSLSQFNAENKYFSFLENAFVASPPPPINFTKSCRVEWQTSTGSSYPVVPIHVQYSHP